MEDYIDIVRVEIDEEPGLSAVYQTPSYSVAAGDKVIDENGVTGIVTNILSARIGSDAEQFITACFGVPKLPKLKGKTTYTEFQYPEEQAS